jgi:ubiquitin carboxyl-terminal hydrolase 4/11/15
MFRALKNMFGVEEGEDFKQVMKEITSLTPEQQAKRLAAGRVELIKEFRLEKKQQELVWGLAGLDNLGNTCFMASALQCLSNAMPLTNYFFKGGWENQLNTLSSPAKGRLACEYYSLLKRMWQEEKQSCKPTNIKALMAKFTRTFTGYSQQDSQEFISYFLDALHEDLNQVIVKPYEPIPDYHGESIATYAEKQFAIHNKRNRSLIVDIFHGQFYSKTQCPECRFESVTCDPFDILSLNVPSMDSCKIEGYIVSSTYEEQILEFKLMCGQYEELNRLMAHFDNTMEKFDSGDYSVYFYLRSRIVENIVFPYKMSVGNAMENENLLFISKNYDPVLCDLVYGELNTLKPKCREQHKHFIQFLIYKSEDLIGIEKELIVPKFSNILDIYLLIYAIHRKAFFEAGIAVESECSSNLKQSREELLAEFEQFFPALNFDPKRSLFKIIIDKQEQVNLKLEAPIFVGENTRVHLRIQVNDKLITNALRLKKCLKIDLPNMQMHRKSLTLQDCFENFALEERLDKDNMWYCSKCKEHRRAFKKMALHKLPEVLIIHLKRFRKSHHSLLSGYKKNETFIDFPLENLDLSEYTKGNNEKAVYNLFGVSNHYGGLSGGHYTAFCRNVLKNRWYHFDDDSVARTEKSIVTPAAYVLFYQKAEK